MTEGSHGVLFYVYMVSKDVALKNCNDESFGACTSKKVHDRRTKIL